MMLIKVVFHKDIFQIPRQRMTHITLKFEAIVNQFDLSEPELVNTERCGNAFEHLPPTLDQ